MILNESDLSNMEQRYRATLINSLAGIRPAVLIGTKSPEGITNLAIFNSLIHIGANPPLYGLIFRPDKVRRDTLYNILNTGYYTINYVRGADLEKAHQTSARYDTGVSEFDKVGFTEYYAENFAAPFVSEAPVKIGMQLEERIDIKMNGTILIIGSIQQIQCSDDIINEDGFVALEKENVLAAGGLDAYYNVSFIKRMPYARP